MEQIIAELNNYENQEDMYENLQKLFQQKVKSKGKEVIFKIIF